MTDDELRQAVTALDEQRLAAVIDCVADRTGLRVGELPGRGAPPAVRAHELFEACRRRGTLPELGACLHAAHARHNLPPLVSGFIGREAELERLRHLLDPPANPAPGTGPPAVSVSGLAGVGKSQLALAHAWDRLDGFDAVYWVRVDATGVTACMVAQLAPLLGIDRDPTADAIRQRLRDGGSVLIVVDGVEEDREWRQWQLGGSRVALLLTTRGTLKGVPCVELEPLPQGQAEALLRGDLRLEPDDEAALTDICELLGRLTLGLAVAHALLAEGTTPTELSRTLASSDRLAWSEIPEERVAFDKHPSLVRLFDASLANLSDHPLDETCRSLFLHLGLLAHEPPSVRLLRALMGGIDGSSADPARVRTVVFRLRFVGLARLDGHGRPELHRLLWEYARARSGEVGELGRATLASYVERDGAREVPERDHRLDAHLSAVADTALDGGLLDGSVVAIVLGLREDGPDDRRRAHLARVGRATDACPDDRPAWRIRLALKACRLHERGGDAPAALQACKVANLLMLEQEEVPVRLRADVTEHLARALIGSGTPAEGHRLGVRALELWQQLPGEAEAQARVHFMLSRVMAGPASGQSLGAFVKGLCLLRDARGSDSFALGERVLELARLLLLKHASGGGVLLPAQARGLQLMRAHLSLSDLRVTSLIRGMAGWFERGLRDGSLRYGDAELRVGDAHLLRLIACSPTRLPEDHGPDGRRAETSSPVARVGDAIVAFNFGALSFETVLGDPPRRAWRASAVAGGITLMQTRPAGESSGARVVTEGVVDAEPEDQLPGLHLLLPVDERELRHAERTLNWRNVSLPYDVLLSETVHFVEHRADLARYGESRLLFPLAAVLWRAPSQGYQRAIAAAKRGLGDDHLFCAGMLHVAADRQRRDGELAESARLMDEARTLVLRTREPTDPLVVQITIDAARARHRSGDPGAAAELYLTAIGASPLATRPAVEQGPLIDLYMAAGQALEQGGRVDESVAHYELVGGIARTLVVQRQVDLSAQLRRWAADAAETFGPAPVLEGLTAAIAADLAILARRDHRSALSGYREALASVDGRLDTGAPVLTDLKFAYATAAVADSRFGAAASVLADLIPSVDVADGPMFAEQLRVLAAAADHGLGASRSALGHIDAALGHRESRLGPDAPELAELLSVKARLLVFRGRAAEALPIARSAVALSEPGAIIHGLGLAVVGAASRHLGHLEEARARLEQSRHELRAHHPDDQVDVLLVDFELAACAVASGVRVTPGLEELARPIIAAAGERAVVSRYLTSQLRELSEGWRRR